MVLKELRDIKVTKDHKVTMVHRVRRVTMVLKGRREMMEPRGHKVMMVLKDHKAQTHYGTLVVHTILVLFTLQATLLRTKVKLGIV